MRTRQILKPVAVALAAAFPCASAGAQMNDMEPMATTGAFDVDVKAGAALPGNDLADYTDVGAAVGLGASYWVSPRVALRVNGNVDILPGATDLPGVTDPLETSLPDMRLWHYGGGIRLDPLRPADSRWSLELTAGAGATTIDTDALPVSAGDPSESFTETYFGLDGGVEVAYSVTENVSVGLTGRSIVSFVDEEDAERLSSMDPALSPIDQSVTFPLMATVEIEMP